MTSTLLAGEKETDRAAWIMRNIQKMLGDSLHPSRVWPTTIEGRAITSGTSPIDAGSRRSISALLRV